MPTALPACRSGELTSGVSHRHLNSRAHLVGAKPTGMSEGPGQAPLAPLKLLRVGYVLTRSSSARQVSSDASELSTTFFVFATRPALLLTSAHTTHDKMVKECAQDLLDAYLLHLLTDARPARCKVTTERAKTC